MQCKTYSSPAVVVVKTDLINGPTDFIPLDQETRTHVPTKVMCHHLGRKAQTARGWASAETYPDGLKPLRVNGRLAWPVAGIRRLLGVTLKVGA